MKKLVTILIVCCFLLGCAESEKASSVWIFGDDDALGLRAGTEVMENIEVGASSMWWSENYEDSQMFGGYAIYHLPADPNGLLGTYIGAQTPLNNDYYDRVAPIAGVVFDEIFFIEYQYRNWESKELQEEDKVIFGVRIPF
jgi:hypothetical protein